MFEAFPAIAFALQVIACLLLLIWMTLVGLGVIVAPVFVSRFDQLIEVLKQIAAK